MTEAGEKVTPASLQRAMSPMQKAAEVRRNLDRLTDLGAEVLYCPVDVTDAGAVTAAIRHGRQRFGSIDGIIHAAGVEISKDLSSKDRSQFDLVYGIKVNGWKALMAATEDDRLDILAAFGSVAGRFGNIGQTDYAAANEYLCKAVKHEAAERGVRTAFTIAWGPWGEVGMATKGSIMQIMEASGVTPIPTADGVRMFQAELATPGTRECVVAGAVDSQEGGARCLGQAVVLDDARVREEAAQRLLLGARHVLASDLDPAHPLARGADRLGLGQHQPPERQRAAARRRA